MNEDMLERSSLSAAPNSRLTCSQCERMVLDAIDEALLPGDRSQFDLHISGCAACSRGLADAKIGGAWLELLRDSPPQPAQDLMERILASTSGDASIRIPPRRAEMLLGTPAVAGVGMPRRGFAPQPSGNWLSRLLQPLTQPRFAMTAAMAFFSVALTLNLTGVQLSQFHMGDLKPANLRHSFWSANARVVRYYDNLRVVYEFESRVHELQQNSDSSPAPQAKQPDKRLPDKVPPEDKRKGRSSLPAAGDRTQGSVVGTGSEWVLLSGPERLGLEEHRNRGEGVKA